MLLQVPATVSGIKALSHRSLRVTVDTTENLSNEEIAGITTKLDKYGWFAFLEDATISEADVLNLPPLPERPEDKKSPATRMRGVLHILWQQQGSVGTSEEFYREYMEKIIEKIKEKLS